MRRLLAVVLGLALLVPAGLAAQRGSHGGRHPAMGRYSRVMGPGERGVARQGRAVAFSPRFLLGMRETLQLTDEQVSQLEGLAGEMRDASEQQHEVMREHRDELRQAWRADRPDVDAMRTHALAMMEARQNVGLTGLTARAQAKGLLNETQRGRVQGWMEARSMRRGSRPFGPDRPGRDRARRFRRHNR